MKDLLYSAMEYATVDHIVTVDAAQQLAEDMQGWLEERGYELVKKEN